MIKKFVEKKLLVLLISTLLIFPIMVSNSSAADFSQAPLSSIVYMENDSNGNIIATDNRLAQATFDYAQWKNTRDPAPMKYVVRYVGGPSENLNTWDFVQYDKTHNRYLVALTNRRSYYSYYGYGDEFYFYDPVSKTYTDVPTITPSNSPRPAYWTSFGEYGAMTKMTLSPNGDLYAVTLWDTGVKASNPSYEMLRVVFLKWNNSTNKWNLIAEDPTTDFSSYEVRCSDYYNYSPATDAVKLTVAAAHGPFISYSVTRKDYYGNNVTYKYNLNSSTGALENSTYTQPYNATGWYDLLSSSTGIKQIYNGTWPYWGDANMSRTFTLISSNLLLPQVYNTSWDPGDNVWGTPNHTITKYDQFYETEDIKLIAKFDSTGKVGVVDKNGAFYLSNSAGGSDYYTGVLDKFGNVMLGGKDGKITVLQNGNFYNDSGFYTQYMIADISSMAQQAKDAATQTNTTMNTIISPKLDAVEGAVIDGSGNTALSVAKQASQNALNANTNAQSAYNQAITATNGINTANTTLGASAGVVQDSSGTVLQSARQAVTGITNLQTQINNIQNYIAPTLTKVSGYNAATATSGTSFNVSLDYSGANEYQVKVDNGSWSGWTSLASHDTNGYFTVSGVSTTGLHTIYVQIRYNGGASLSPVAKGKMTLFKL
jgi:hypothetical protein